MPYQVLGPRSSASCLVDSLEVSNDPYCDFPVLHCTVLYCTILHCPVLYYSILYYTTCYSIASTRPSFFKKPTRFLPISAFLERNQQFQLDHLRGTCKPTATCLEHSSRPWRSAQEDRNLSYGRRPLRSRIHHLIWRFGASTQLAEDLGSGILLNHKALVSDRRMHLPALLKKKLYIQDS